MLRRPARNPLFRLLAHVLIRLLVIAPLPSDWQLLSLVFPLNLVATIADDAAGPRRKGAARPRESGWDSGSGDQEGLKLARWRVRSSLAKACVSGPSAVSTLRSSRKATAM